LGYLPAPDKARLGQRWQFVARRGRLGEGHDLVSLPISLIEHPGGVVALAYKSEETPLETLRRIPGFIEATIVRREYGEKDTVDEEA
jgi:hypothetical protein